MSALARYFLAQGDQVSGSDAVGSEITEELGKMGAEIFIGQNTLTSSGNNLITSPQPSPSKREGDNPPNPHLRNGGENAKSPLAPLLQSGEQIDSVIYSAAVREDNPELVEARRLGIKTQKYAEALGELTKEKYTIAISGMHGKSTTTAMIGLIMEKAGLDPTVIVGTKVRWNLNPPNPHLRNGGQDTNSSQPPLAKGGENYSNFRAGKSRYLVIEADEYDKSILNYWPKILALLNIEEEHLDTYTGGLTEIMETFERYISHLPEGGALVANEEDENVQKIFNFQFSIFNKNSNSKFKIQKYNSIVADGLNLKIPGRHNISNANAALAVARILGIDEKIAVEALNEFNGTWRRMEYKGEVNGAKIYDDYGHHPTEIKATLEGARELLKNFNPHNPPLRNGEGKLWCVFQPHQYQRTYDLFDQFVSAFGAADKIILLPIYSVAGREDEEIKKQVSLESLAKALIANRKAQDAENIIYLDNFYLAAEYLRKKLQAGDVCVIMGAGDVYKLTNQLLI